MTTLRIRVRDAAAMESLGEQAAAGVRAGQLVFLRGELGAGKTTFIRGVLRGLGHRGAVTSPTYTLVEPYQVGGLSVYHFDLYRIVDAEELENLAVRDYLDGEGVCLVEWPERGQGVLPAPDCEIVIDFDGDGTRLVECRCETELGDALCECLSDH